MKRIALAVEATQSSAQDIGSLTPAQVQSQLAAGRIRVFDANSVDIFNKHHVRGATRLEYETKAIVGFYANTGDAR